MLVVIVDLTVQYCYVGCYGGFDCTILDLCTICMLVVIVDLTVQYCYVGCYRVFEYNTMLCWFTVGSTWLYNIAMLVVVSGNNIAMLVVIVDLTVHILLCWLL